MLEGGDVVPLLDDEHGEGAEDVAGDHDDDEEQNHEDDHLLDAHHAVDGLVLHVFVLDGEAGAEGGADLFHCLTDVGAGSEPELHGACLIVLESYEPAGPLDGDEEGVAVALIAREEGAYGEEPLAVEGCRRID